jgi:hypothetical protein
MLKIQHPYLTTHLTLSPFNLLLLLLLLVNLPSLNLFNLLGLNLSLLFLLNFWPLLLKTLMNTTNSLVNWTMLG